MSFLYPPKVLLLFIFAADSSSVIPTLKTDNLTDRMSVNIFFERQNGL